MKPRLRLRLYCAAAISAAFDKKKRKEKRRAPCLSCVGYYILLFNLSYSSRGSEDGAAALKHTAKGHIFNKPAACTVSNSSYGGGGGIKAWKCFFSCTTRRGQTSAGNGGKGFWEAPCASWDLCAPICFCLLSKTMKRINEPALRIVYI